METQKRDFKGIWIPKEIWLSEDLSLQEKVFLVEINSLDNEDGCYANNEYFSKFFGISKRRVSEVINLLVEKGYITSTVLEDVGNKRVLKMSGGGIEENFHRVWKKTSIGCRRKVPEGIEEKFQHNNTVNNTYNNTTNNKTPEVKTSLPTYNGNDKKLTDYLLGQVKKRYPFTKKKTDKQLIKEYEEMNRIHRLDDFDYQTMLAVINFSQTDNFWKQNIRSVSTLRKQFETLLIQADGKVQEFKRKQVPTV